MSYLPCSQGTTFGAVLTPIMVPTTAPVGIKTVQYLLKARGYKVKVDGRFGQQTKDAVQRFQVSRKLSPSGIMTAATWDTLVTKLRRGSKGHAVRALQIQLNLLGYKTKFDGVFGAQTEKAVREFQRRSKLTVDGLAGRETWSWLAMQTAMYYE